MCTIKIQEAYVKFLKAIILLFTRAAVNAHIVVQKATATAPAGDQTSKGTLWAIFFITEETCKQLSK